MVKTNEEISYIRESSKIVAKVFLYIEKFLIPGITTHEIDKHVEEYILSFDAKPAFKGYKVNRFTFPASCCISINEEVVHGIPSDRKLIEGDIVSIDIGVVKNGYYGDSAMTFAIGNIANNIKKLLSVTERSLYEGINNAIDGNYVNDVSLAIQKCVESEGFSIVRELVGHGIGSNLHEEPPIPNYYNSGNRYILREGMTVAIEPMVNYGTFKVKMLDDHWTYVTKDGKPSAHFEHSVLIRKGKPEILTHLN